MFRLVHKSVLATMAGVAAAGMLLASSPVTAFASNATGSSVRRACAPSADANVMSCFVLVRTDRTARPASQFRFGTPTGYGYGPSQLQSAYLLPSSTAGAGESVERDIARMGDPFAAAVEQFRGHAPGGLPRSLSIQRRRCERRFHHAEFSRAGEDAGALLSEHKRTIMSERP